jgi:dipeptidyl aminopeptidase/acylaminoacyl peptidase
VRLCTVGLAASLAFFAPAAGGASGSGGGEMYSLRVVGATGGAARLLFQSPVLPAGYSAWSFVDLSPGGGQALMVNVLPGGQPPQQATDALYLANVRGRLERLLVKAGSDSAQWGRWSPDGTRFAFRTFEGGACGGFTFWSADARGRDVRRLGAGQLFGWGPGHESFAIERGCGGSSGDRGPLVFTDARGHEHIVATGWHGGLAVSPEGDQIAYETYAPTATVLHVARTDGSGEITAIRGASSASWSPDGRRLVFTYGPGRWQGAIGVASAAGRRGRTIVPGTNLRAPAWSPDGRRIAYVRGYRALETVAPTGRAMTTLARARPLLSFWWSANGRRIYYDGLG